MWFARDNTNAQHSHTQTTTMKSWGGCFHVPGSIFCFFCSHSDSAPNSFYVHNVILFCSSSTLTVLPHLSLWSFDVLFYTTRILRREEYNLTNLASVLIDAQCAVIHCHSIGNPVIRCTRVFKPDFVFTAFASYCFMEGANIIDRDLPISLFPSHSWS